MKTSTPSLRAQSPKAARDPAVLWSEPRPTPLIMGILNATPDSFYAASQVLDPEAAAEAGRRMQEEGADMIDVGGQSTRPGSQPVDEAEELRRAIPVVAALAKSVNVPVSIDTDKAAVARRALDAGAVLINDVSALRGDPQMMDAALKARGVVLMHRGSPTTGDVVREVKDFFAERVAAFARAGGDASRVLLDPGIGFGKGLDLNLQLLKHLDRLAALGRPILVGISRKSFLGRIMAGQSSGDKELAAGDIPGPERRFEGSLAAACWAALQGAAVLRVHDVGATRRALDALAAIAGAR